MKKILSVSLVLAMCLCLVTVSVARYSDIHLIQGSARATSSTEIYCSALLGAYSDVDIEIELIVTDRNGNEIASFYESGYGDSLSLSEYIDVEPNNTYYCKFYFTCGADSPVISRTVKT